MGLGITARYRRCAKYWDKHLKLCRDFQENCLLDFNKPKASIAIFGAGRLLDVNLEAVKSKFTSVSLYDADPTCLRSWKKQFLDFSGKSDFRVMDLTASLEQWTRDLKFFLESTPSKTIEALTSYLEKLTPLNPTEIRPVDVVISLNLLSQIPVYWRDRANFLIKKIWQIDTKPNGQYENSNLQQALNKTLRLLQEQHLNLLLGSQAERIIFISDIEWYYYTHYQAQWQSETAIWLEEDLIKLLSSTAKYQLSKQDSWLWHIAPQGLEEKDYGAIHKVRALELRKK